MKVPPLIGVPALVDLEDDPRGTDVGRYTITDRVVAMRDAGLSCPYCHGPLKRPEFASPHGTARRVVKVLGRDARYQQTIVQAPPDGVVAVRCDQCAMVFTVKKSEAQ